MQAALNHFDLNSNRMTVALISAIVIHAILIFGITFNAIQKEKQRAMHLQYVEIKKRSQDKTPDNYDFASTVDQQGGGEKRTPDIPQKPQEQQMADPRNGVSKMSTRTPTPEPANQQRKAEVVKTQQSQQTVDASKTSSRQTTSFTAAQLIANINQQASLEARIEATRQAEAKLPRTKYVTASTKSFASAQYIESWRQKVERLGNLNYPTEARRNRLNGTLRLVVYLLPDGNIDLIEVDQGSGHRILDQAAIDIVKLGAPYARIPKNVLGDNDRLAIVRTWEFSSGNTLRTRY